MGSRAVPGGRLLVGLGHVEAGKPKGPGGHREPRGGTTGFPVKGYKVLTC